MSATVFPRKRKAHKTRDDLLPEEFHGSQIAMDCLSRNVKTLLWISLPVKKTGGATDTVCPGILKLLKHTRQPEKQQ